MGLVQWLRSWFQQRGVKEARPNQSGSYEDLTHLTQEVRETIEWFSSDAYLEQQIRLHAARRASVRLCKELTKTVQAFNEEQERALLQEGQGICGLKALKENHEIVSAMERLHLEEGLVQVYETQNHLLTHVLDYAKRL